MAILGAVTLATQSTATPPAGAPISNQATATYSDAGNTQRTATSNTVTTYVAQVGGETLTASQAKNAAPGTQVYYTHTLTNTGNGIDTFALSGSNTGGFALTGLTLFADANGDGIPDNNTAITSSGPLAAGGIFKFVAVGTVPPGQVQNDTSTITIATSGTAGPITPLTNTDVTTVNTTSAIVNVTKAFSQTSGTAGSGPVTVTFTYTNTGNVTASNLTVSDTLNSVFSYVAGSSHWSVIGGALTDNGTTTSSGSNTIITGTSAGNVISYAVKTVAPGESRTISFSLMVSGSALAGIVPNVASVAYDPTGTNQAATPQSNTNVANFTVLPTAAVVLTGTTVVNATQGQTVPFQNTVTNNGNATDTFVITYANGTFPAGSSYQLFKSDGVTPLSISINGNTDPDTGPLAPGQTYVVVMKVTLPTGVVGGTNYTLTKTAHSTNDPTKTSSGNDVLGTILANTVDLTNTSPIVTTGTATGQGVSSPGYGSTGSTPILTSTANPGTTVRFPIWVNNTSTTSDTYDLTVVGTIPAGWNVVFKDSTGAVITNTGLINSGTTAKLVYADVTSPVLQPPGTTGFDFRALSPTTGATDVIHDNVVTTTVRSISVTPNNTGQAYPGGSVYYSHTIANNGNVFEGGTTASLTVTTSVDSLPGWSSIVYYDANGTGVIANNDPVISNTSTLAIASGSSIKVIVKVIAPPGAAIGQIDKTTVTVTTNQGSYTVAAPAVASATDSTSVISGDLVLVKSQALDTTGSSALGSLTFTTQTLSNAAPGSYIRYRIVATNQGSAPATNVVINDQTPTFTTYSNAAAPILTTTGTSTPVVTGTLGNGATGQLQFSFGTLNPGENGTVVFGVRINP